MKAYLELPRPEAEISVITGLIGPLHVKGADSPETVRQPEAWQSSFYKTALNGLKKVLGKETPITPEALAPPEHLIGALALRQELTPVRKRLGMTLGLGEYIRAYKSEERETELRDHQKEAFDGILTFLKNKNRPGFIKMPTGTGKTAVFTTLIKVVKEHESPQEPLNTLILVPSIDLIHQTLGRDGKRGLGRFAKKIPFGAWFGKQKDHDMLDKNVVMTFDSFRLAVENDLINDETYDLIIGDEIHELCETKAGDYLQEFGKKATVIGVSATPEKVISQFPEEIFKIKLPEAIDRDLLAPAESLTYKTNYRLREDDRFAGQDDFSLHETEHLARLEARNEIIIEKTVEMVKEKGLQGIVRCFPGDDMAHAKEVARILWKEHGIKAAAVHGNLKPHERELILKAFERGKIQVLTFYNTISRGWDSDVAKFIVDGVPCRDPSLKEQILGRILRYLEDEEGNAIKGYAIDIIDESTQEYCTFAHILKGITYTNFKKRRPPKDTIKKILIDAPQDPTPEDLTKDVTATLIEDFEVRSSNVSFTVGEAAYALGLNRLQLERYMAGANMNFRKSRGGDYYLIEKDIDKLAAYLIDKDVPIDRPTTM